MFFTFALLVLAYWGTQYTLCLPTLPQAHRERELVLVPTAAWVNATVLGEL